MKTKGISFWEQHIERFVLGLALLMCVVLVAMQFLGEPNAVQVGVKTISPGQVDAELEKQAREVESKLDSTSSVDVTKATEPVLPRFVTRLSTPVVPEMRMAVSSHRIGVNGSAIPSADRPFVIPKVPVPTDIALQQFFDTIQPDVVTATPALKTLLASEAPPFDATWFTIGAKFDLAGLLRQYREPGPNNEAPLLSSWYNDRVDFIDLKLEREEYVDGQWTNRTLVEPLPGYFSFRIELQGKTIDDAFRVAALSRAAEPPVREQVIQPPFYDTLTESWTAPGGAAAGPAKPVTPDDPAADLKAQREELQVRLDAVVKRLKSLGCPDSAPADTQPPKPAAKQPQPTGGGGGGGAAPGSGIGGDVGAGAGLRGVGGKGPVDLTKCKSAWATKTKLVNLLAKLDDKIAKLTGQAVEKPKEVEVENKPETIIDIWAHDLNIKPGKTYRYRFTVEVYNPLFGRKLALIAAQQPLAEQFTMSSEASEWTEPMTAQPPLRLFVTRAQAANPAVTSMALGQAVAEVYRFHNGRWWLDSFPVNPGDRVGDTKATHGGPAVDFGTDWFLLDVVPILGGTSDDDKSGLGATVMLQSLTDPDKIEWRSPRRDSTDPDRRRLSGRVKLAELGGDAVASSATGKPDGSGNATN